MPCKPRPLWDRVWAKVDQSGGQKACWRWLGAHSRKKRKELRPVVQTAGRGSKIAVVARVMCEWRHGPPPTPQHEAGHVCPGRENHWCINPFHLEWMTRTENEIYKHIDRALSEVA